MMKLVKQYKFVCISYVMLLLLMIIGAFIPQENDVMWLWGWGFYVPFIIGGVHVYGLILGIHIQHKTSSGWLKIFQNLIIYFIFMFFLLLTWDFAIILKGLGFDISKVAYHTLGPAILSSVCFLIGEMIMLGIQALKKKRKTSQWE